MIGMRKDERNDLRRLIQQRQHVLKSAAKQRLAELLADFENQMASGYAFDDYGVWQEAARAAEQVLRIPQNFAPTLDLQWSHRGYDNLLERRKTELRKAATSRIEAMEKKAILEIEMQSLDAQTQIAASGLTSAAAETFIAQLPTIETLMPRLIYSEVSDETEPPIIEPLVSPNALRQRRFRGRQAALRNGSEALQSASRTAQGDDENTDDGDDQKAPTA
jgi:hypothetical protein